MISYYPHNKIHAYQFILLFTNGQERRHVTRSENKKTHAESQKWATTRNACARAAAIEWPATRNVMHSGTFGGHTVLSEKSDRSVSIWFCCVHKIPATGRKYFCEYCLWLSLLVISPPSVRAVPSCASARPTGRAARRRSVLAGRTAGVLDIDLLVLQIGVGLVIVIAQAAVVLWAALLLHSLVFGASVLEPYLNL